MRSSLRHRALCATAIAAAFLLGFVSFASAAGESEVIAPYHSRFGRQRPIVAVVGLTRGTETTDYLIPYGVLTQSQAAEVIALGTEPGPIHMMPALKIEPQATIRDFDTRFPDGADYVIVPAVHDPNDATLIDWVRTPSHKCAIVIGVCDGVWIVANAGLLNGHRATGHWYSLSSLEKKFTGTRWARNRRYVADGSVVTTTGVTASIPVSLALVEAIAGHDRASAVARDLGATDWSTTHNSNDFSFSSHDIVAAARNKLFFWSHEDVGIRVSAGTDEIALALIADPYSRTYRSQALTVADSTDAIPTRRGLKLIPDAAANSSKIPARILPQFDSNQPVQALDWSLNGIASAYGPSTADFVALQMEYSAPAASERDAGFPRH